MCNACSPPSPVKCLSYYVPAPREVPGGTGEDPGSGLDSLQREKRQPGPRPWPESQPDTWTRQSETPMSIRHQWCKDESGRCPSRELHPRGQRHEQTVGITWALWGQPGCEGGTGKLKEVGERVSRAGRGGGPQARRQHPPVQTPQPSSVWARPSGHSQRLLLWKWASPQPPRPQTPPGPTPLHTHTPVGKPVCRKLTVRGRVQDELICAPRIHISQKMTILRGHGELITPTGRTIRG